MKRLCVFCGQRPISKAPEHVISEWLIKLTGDPKRRAFFGINPNTRQKIRFSFDNFKFPACDSCNNRFSGLENEAKVVVTNLLSEQPISNHSFHTLLTWFDKLRIGLWLGCCMLFRIDIKPKFHIATRIDKWDRMLLIYKTTTNKIGINIHGTNCPLFFSFPSFFGLSINNYFFSNVSTQFLFSSRLGLPYPEEFKYINEEQEEYPLKKGKEYINMPLLRGFNNKGCTEIYQPIHPVYFVMNNILSGHYINDYVRKFLDIRTGLGKILISKNGKEIGEYPDDPSKIWIPQETFNLKDLLLIWYKDSIFLQNVLIDSYSRFKDRPAERIKRDNNLIKITKRWNKRFLEIIEKDPLFVLPKKPET
jgi:hypothetical protein